MNENLGWARRLVKNESPLSLCFYNDKICPKRVSNDVDEWSSSAKSTQPSGQLLQRGVFYNGSYLHGESIFILTCALSPFIMEHTDGERMFLG
jgi:hypothetical protein